jgi:hypothetical protein
MHPIKVPQDDYSRMERAIGIYADIEQVRAGISLADIETNRMVTLALIRLVDLLASNHIED